ncbi:hypothetical protein HDK90DRAFT_18652 [Phyllosticta capitalensis]|uniref:Uncharacterized protein n=1 Tax=Phyllosticta capitalensis TaxID=121624 RepID=A0ABR1Z3V2_9PEZI
MSAESYSYCSSLALSFCVQCTFIFIVVDSQDFFCFFFSFFTRPRRHHRRHLCLPEFGITPIILPSLSQSIISNPSPHSTMPQPYAFVPRQTPCPPHAPRRAPPPPPHNSATTPPLRASPLRRLRSRVRVESSFLRAHEHSCCRVFFLSAGLTQNARSGWLPRLPGRPDGLAGLG